MRNIKFLNLTINDIIPYLSNKLQMVYEVLSEDNRKIGNKKRNPMEKTC